MDIRQRIISRGAALIFVGVLAYQAAAYNRVALDDTYIFFQYAKNIASGQGYVFNPGEHVLGTTSPLYTLVLAAGQFLFGWLPFFALPVLGRGISIVSLLTISLVIAGFFRRAGLERGATMLPVIMLAMAPFWNAVAMDVMPAMALGLLAIDQYRRDRFKTTAALGALAVLARPDLVLIPGLLFLDRLLLQRRWPGWSTLGVFVAILVPWLVFSQAYFGTVVPSSVVAKIGQANSGAWGGEYDFIRKSVKFWPFHVSIKDATLVAWGVATVLLVAGCRRFRNFHAGWLVLLWVLLYMLSYGFVLKPAAYRWYYAPFAVGIAVMLAMGAEVAAEWLARRRPVFGTVFVGVILVWSGWIGADLATRTFRDPFNYKYRFYTEAAAWLNGQAEPGTVVGCNEIGVLGYYYRQGPLLDLLGLVDTEVAEIIRTGDLAKSVAVFRPDFLLIKEPPSRMDEAAFEPWFPLWYDQVKVFGDGGTRLGVYRYVGPERVDNHRDRPD